VLWFLDNESAKMALIRNFSPILDSFLLLQTNAKLDIETQSKNWYSRVPSRSNPSDSASRLEFGEYASSMKCEPCYTKVSSTFSAFELLLKSLEVGSENCNSWYTCKSKDWLLRVVTRFSFGHRAFCVANEMWHSVVMQTSWWDERKHLLDLPRFVTINQCGQKRKIWIEHVMCRRFVFLLIRKTRK